MLSPLAIALLQCSPRAAAFTPVTLITLVDGLHDLEEMLNELDLVPYSKQKVAGEVGGLMAAGRPLDAFSARTGLDMASQSHDNEQDQL